MWKTPSASACSWAQWGVYVSKSPHRSLRLPANWGQPGQALALKREDWRFRDFFPVVWLCFRGKLMCLWCYTVPNDLLGFADLPCWSGDWCCGRVKLRCLAGSFAPVVVEVAPVRRELSFVLAFPAACTLGCCFASG